jgi:hypothetical protein
LPHARYEAEDIQGGAGKVQDSVKVYCCLLTIASCTPKQFLTYLIGQSLCNGNPTKMSPHSPVYVEVDDIDREPNARRPRSTDDFLKDQPLWNRRDRERQMVRYREGNYFGATQQRTGDRLAVPEFASSPRHRRARSEDTRTPHSDGLSRNYIIKEVRPSPAIDSHQELVSERENERHQRGSTHSKTPAMERPKIKIPPVIVQEHPPDRKSGVSPSASPRSPSGRPKLQIKYLLLQNKLADVILACVRYIDVEAAHPQDLTFEKISEQVKGFAFDLRVWSQIANIQNMARKDVPDDAKAIADAASRNMERIVERATELHDACLDAKPSDLKLEQLEKVEDEDGMFEDVGDGQ